MVDILCPYCQLSHLDQRKHCYVSEPHPEKALPLLYQWGIGGLDIMALPMSTTYIHSRLYLLPTQNLVA